MNDPKTNVKGWINEKLFDAVPMSIAVIDRDYNVIQANSAFEQMFGEWQKKKCFKVYKSRDSVCSSCAGSAAFRDGQPRINEELGFNKEGKPTSYIKYTVPISDENGDIPFLIEMSTDITDFDLLKKELQLLFDQVPCNIAILDKNLNIVRSNRRIREKFGDVEGQVCHRVLKGLDERCHDCPAWRTLQDGQVHSGHSVVKNRTGDDVHLFVTTAPLQQLDGSVDRVVEMAMDISQTMKLESDLRIANSFLETLVGTSIDGIVATDKNGHVQVFNRSAREICRIPANHHVTANELKAILPKGFVEQVNRGPGNVYLPDTKITTLSHEPIPVRLVGVRLVADREYLGSAFTIQDLSKIKELEKANLDAERLAAVGETVAGLAHGVKNLIAGLEGGMYMLNTGIHKGESERIVQGWDILDRNIGRISSFVKAFLGFARGRKIEVAMVDPASVARDVVELYSANAEKEGISLEHETVGTVASAPLDEAGIHECLTNLVGNAIDACQMSEKDQTCHVRVRTFEQNDTLLYEVIDNGCGIDYEIKKKVFTTFFTTKGLGGTGLGLLTTRKIVQEHGGRIELESEPGQGTTFRILLPRNRLPEMEEDSS